jgi:hypothetical protein
MASGGDCRSHLLSAELHASSRAGFALRQLPRESVRREDPRMVFLECPQSAYSSLEVRRQLPDSCPRTFFGSCMLLNRPRHPSPPARTLAICLSYKKWGSRRVLGVPASVTPSRHVLDAPLARPRRARRPRPWPSAQLHRVFRRLVRGGCVCGREHVVADPQAGRVRPCR